MADSQSKVQQVKALRTLALSLRGATQRWREKYGDRKHYDKQGFGFTRFDRATTAAFVVNKMVFDAYVGTYGSSSVSRAWSVDQALMDRYLCDALNKHKQDIFDTIAALAEADAAKLVAEARAELEAVQTMLTEVESSAASAA